MHTEDEAKTKICPQTFAVPEIRGADGCGIVQGGPYPCIGSACMAWRWSQSATITESAVGPSMPEGDGWKDDGLAWAHDTDHDWSRHVPRTNRAGYCGLAGKPDVS